MPVGGSLISGPGAVSWGANRIDVVAPLRGDDQLDQIVVQHYGRFAVTRSRYTQTGHMGDEPRDDTYLMTDAFVKQSGRWRVVARHISPLAQESI